MEATYKCWKCGGKWQRSQLKQVTAYGSGYQPTMIYYTCPNKRCGQAIFSERVKQEARG